MSGLISSENKTHSNNTTTNKQNLECHLLQLCMVKMFVFQISKRMSAYNNQDSDEDLEIDASKFSRKSPPKRTRRRARPPESDSDDDGHNEKLLLSMSELKVGSVTLKCGRLTDY